MLNTKSLIDDAASLIQDNSATVRAKLLTWLTMTMQAVIDAKKLSPPWRFLHKTVDLAVSENMIAKPQDFAQVVNIKIGTGTFLTANDMLTDEDAFLLADASASSPIAAGFTISPTSVVFWPGATGTATLKYAQSLPVYIEDESNTIFPNDFRNVLVRGTLALYYEYDMDERFASAPAAYQQALSVAMKGDNVGRGMPKRNSHGYMRDRT